MTTTTDTTTATRHERMATSLRNLADVIEQNPDLQLPYEIRVSVSAYEQLDRWSGALVSAGHDVTDRTTDHDRSLDCPSLALSAVKVHDEPMRRYYAERRFLKEHRAEIDAALAVVACSKCAAPLHDDDPSNTGLGYHVDCTADGALAGQPA